MNKAERLKKQAQEDTQVLYNNTDLYVSNTEYNANQEMVITPIEQKKEMENVIKDNKLKMMSFRVPQEVKDNIDKYAYIQRLNKQEVIIMCFETFFKDTQVQDILKQYEKLKENK